MVALEGRAPFAEYSARSVAEQATSASVEVIAVSFSATRSALESFAEGLGPEIRMSCSKPAPKVGARAQALAEAFRASDAEIAVLHSGNAYWTSEDKLQCQVSAFTEREVDFSWHPVLRRSDNALGIEPAGGCVESPRGPMAWESIAITRVAFETLINSMPESPASRIATTAADQLHGTCITGLLAVIQTPGTRPMS